MEIDHDALAAETIRRNNEAWERLASYRAPDPPKERFMTPETFIEHKIKADILIAKLQSRNFAEGPRGD
jgi:hypothetical protein